MTQQGGGTEARGESSGARPAPPAEHFPRFLWMFPQFLMKDNKCSKVQNNAFYSFQE